MDAEPLPGPHVLVSCGSLQRVLAPGQTLTFGRGRGHDIRVGHAPEDLRVPRLAGKLECREDGVLVHNLSDKRSLEVQTFPGPSYDILPLMIAGTRPHPQVRVIVKGGSSTYAIAIDARPLGTAAPAAPPTSATDEFGTIGFDRITDMSGRHRLLLSALCLPLMTQTGLRARVPTYAEIEVILRRHGHAIRARTIRNGLDELRHWLTDAHGIDGLTARADQQAAEPERLVAALARWAVLSGNITDDDLDALDADEHEGSGPDRR
jgi:hypothetical protein